jgi:hypothetical protein
MLVFYCGTVLDKVARLRPVFALFVVGFFDTSAFQLSLAAWEASHPGSGCGA